MRRIWIMTGALLLSVGCSSTDDALGGPPVDEGAEVGGEDNGLPPYEEGDGGAADTGGSDGSDSGTGDDADPSGEETTGAPPTAKGGCPDDAPVSWLFCEDFEGIDDPLEPFTGYSDARGAFVLDDTVGASGTHSMRADYLEGEEGSGWLHVAFGVTPVDHGDRPVYESERYFEDIYWRFRVRHQEGWPDIGPGHLTRAMTLASEDWSEALVAQLRSTGTSTTVEAVPITCIKEDQVGCAGFNDETEQEMLDAVAGETQLFSEALSGQWHCVEAHVQLNELGAIDGVLEFWINDELENRRDDIDWRGGWQQFGLNGVMIENFWPGGAPEGLSRWIDDVVVATEPIGCD